MRKDVQFGLTIGGALLVVLVVWVSVVNHATKNPDSNNETILQPPAEPAAAPTTQPAEPATQPATVLETSTPTTEPSPGMINVTDAGGPSAVGKDWDSLLNSGSSSPQSNVVPASADTIINSDATDAGPTTRPSVATTATGGRTHLVQRGETFFTISQAAYGSSRYWKRIVDANPQVNPNRLRIGTTINIPDLHASAPISTQSAQPAALTQSKADLDPTTSYRVQPSDTLEGIARKLYGDGQQWQRLYDANKDAIGANPARLKVDMVLRLPQPPTVTVN
jgi:nucleoid-associated protein YgaU